MQDFIRRIVSSSGFVCVATPSPEHKGFNHYKTDTPAKAEWLAKKLVAEGKDVYFAIGTLREKFIEINGKKRSRCAENIHEVKSLIVDLDVGEKKDYKTQGEAVKHLVQFVKDVGMPSPLVVSSGYGIHAYWPFTRGVPGDKWQVLAAHFKALTQAYGLKADPSRTADVASILRLPGTLNFKNPDAPQEVRVLSRKPVPDTPPKTIVQIVAAGCKTFGVKAKVHEPKAKVDTGLGSFEVAQEPADFKEIVSKCQIIRKCVEDQASVSEPLWQLVLMTARHCQDAETLVHEVSRKHPGYTPEGTDEKVANLVAGNVGPALCDTFDSRCPGSCDGCESRGKIKSPIALGRSLKEAVDKPTMVIDHGNGETSTVELPKPPYPYMRTVSGAIAIRCKDEAGKEIDPEVIYDFDIHPTKRMYDEVEQTEVFWFRSFLPHDGWRDYAVPSYLIYDERKLMELLARQGVMPDMAQKSRLVGYMLGYIQSLQRQMPADQIYSQFGWRKNDSEIVIGNRCYTKSGTKQVKVSEQFAKVTSKFEASGTLEEWKKVVNVYNHPGWEDFAFGLMMGFGQLLFKFSGYEGAIFNLHGDSGAGKSTLLKLIHSIYGVPTEKSLLHQDTINAKITVIGAYNNLPVTYDEITNIDPHEMSDLAYAMSNGRGKESLKQDRTLRTNTTTWQTTMYCTSNDPLVPMLTSLKGKASGEIFRIMERSVKAGKRYTLNEARKVFAPLDTNYGVAGGVIADWLVHHHDQAREMMHDAFSEISDLVKGESPERFWLGMCAQAIAGARLGKMLGLHDYDENMIVSHAVKIIHDARGVVVRDTKTPIDMLIEFTNSNLNRMLATRVDKNGFIHEDLKPTQGVLIRHELDKGHLYIAKHAFKEWCVERHYDGDAILNYLQDKSMIIADHAPRSLGAGTVFATGRTVCFCVDTAHPEMCGATKLAAVKPPAHVVADAA